MPPASTEIDLYHLDYLTYLLKALVDSNVPSQVTSTLCRSLILYLLIISSLHEILFSNKFE